MGLHLDMQILCSRKAAAINQEVQHDLRDVRCTSPFFVKFDCSAEITALEYAQSKQEISQCS